MASYKKMRSYLAVASFRLGLLGLLLVLLGQFFVIFVTEKTIPMFLAKLCTTVWVVSLSSGILSFINIDHVALSSSDKKSASWGIAISFIPLFLTWYAPCVGYPLKRLGHCEKGLSRIGQSMRSYAVNHDDQIPPASQWCDLLLSDTNISPKTFICYHSNDQQSQSSYALNENIIGRKLSSIPGDTVLLFESVPGWNQTGGIELLTTRPHEILGNEIITVLLFDGTTRKVRIKNIKRVPKNWTVV